MTGPIAAPTLVPLSAIARDPNNPRPEPAAVELDDLVATIRRDTLLQPIALTPHPDPAAAAETPYMILHGHRRFAAYRLLEEPAIPAFLYDQPLAPYQRLLRQLAENDSDARHELPLFARAKAIAQAFRLSGVADQRQFAKEIGRSASWVTVHLQLARADGFLREALEEGLLRRAQAAQTFRRLPPALQERLLLRARRTKVPITEHACLDAARYLPEPPLPPPEPSDEADAPAPVPARRSVLAAAPAPQRRDSQVVTLALTAEQLRTLIRYLGADPTRGGLSELASQFTELLAERFPLPSEGDPR